MKARRHFLLTLGSVLILAIAALCTWMTVRSARGYSGDGVLHDNGFFSYPRFRVTFSAIDLGSQTNHSLTLQGIPRARMTFGFEVVADGNRGSNKINPERFMERSAELRTQIKSANGEVIAEANAPIKDWVLAQSTRRELLWLPALRDLRFDPGKQYRILIEYRADQADLGSLIVRPVLEGGGNELP
jgi:hypothetical protein